MNSSNDDGFRNYEENKAKLEAEAERDDEREANIDAVVRSQQLNELKKRDKDWKIARDFSRDQLTQQN